MNSAQSDNLLELKDVRTHFPIFKGSLIRKKIGSVKAVDGVSLDLAQGEILGLVGESGCGKSTLGRTIMQLVRATSGKITLDGKKLTELDAQALRRARTDFQMIFQDPYASLDPRMTVFDTLAEPLLTHGLAKGKDLPRQIAELMETVGLAPRFMKKYPHEFSGGQRQRIAIARALALKPKLIIADEPVSALDVSIQSQILNLLIELSKKFNLTMIFISHDLSVVKHISDRVAVMYLGKIVELGQTEAIFANPLHPYTQALMSAIPEPDPRKEATRERILLEGDPPSPIDPPSGCSFHPRCPRSTPQCSSEPQSLKNYENETSTQRHDVACFRVES